MKVALLLVALLLAVGGRALWRNARNRTAQTATSFICWSVFAWLLSAIFALIATLAIAHAQSALPVNPDVTQETIKQTICKSGWTATVRPSASFTNKIKFSKMDVQGIPRSRSSELELDHVLSIEVGGALSDPRNLRLQWWYGDDVQTPGDADGVDSQAHAKDITETAVKRRICSGEMTLQEGQACLWNDWRACAAKLGLPTRKETP